MTTSVGCAPEIWGLFRWLLISAALPSPSTRIPSVCRRRAVVSVAVVGPAPGVGAAAGAGRACITGADVRAFRLIEFGRPPVLVDVDCREPMGSELLLRIEAAGICGTDLALLTKGQRLGPSRSTIHVGTRELRASRGGGLRRRLALGRSTGRRFTALGLWQL